jgi:hypothetical protein
MQHATYDRCRNALLEQAGLNPALVVVLTYVRKTCSRVGFQAGNIDRCQDDVSNFETNKQTYMCMRA